MNYTFGAQKMEYNSKAGANTKTWESHKYLEGKKKAIELIDKTEYGLTEADFWILKTYSAKTVTYAGLIISHNGCLKINDKLAAEAKFVPSCVSWVRNGAGDLVLQYLNDKQGLLEFGEASIKNCTNAYPFAMVLKRLQDRVILKNSKIAFSGIMSEVESEEFKCPERPERQEREERAKADKPANLITKEQIAELEALGCDLKRVAAAYKVTDIREMTSEQAERVIDRKKGALNK